MRQRATTVLGFRRQWRVACVLAASLMLAGPSAHATVQVLPEMTLKREGQSITGAKAIRADQTMQDILTAFDRAEHALERQEQECSSEPRGYWGFGDGGESPAYWRQVSCWQGRRRMPPYKCCLR